MSSATEVPGLFVTTRWSVVLRARDVASPDSAAALEALCRTYWYPLYSFVRRQGHSPHDAQDLTQEFISRLIAKGYLQAAAQEKGRFRTFLRVAMKRFLANEWDKVRAQKRGGGDATIPFDTALAEVRFQQDGLDARPPEHHYDRQWALALLEQALARLRAEYESSQRTREFDHLKQYLTAERGSIPYAEIGSQLSMTEGAARVAVHRLRKRFRELFRAAVADTVASPAEVDDEIRHVAALLGDAA